jgi:cobalt-zinc-cadmium resistance protein CzcA
LSELANIMLTVADAQERIAKNVKLPVGYRIIWAGKFEDLEKAKERLEIIIPVSLLLIMGLLYGPFNSLRDSLLALAGIPFAVAGGILALYVSGLDLSISSAIGFVSLLGVSVMDGILMITYYNQVHRTGASAIESMYHAATQRMRPICRPASAFCRRRFRPGSAVRFNGRLRPPSLAVCWLGRSCY